MFNSVYVRIYTIKILDFSNMDDLFLRFILIYLLKIQSLNTLTIINSYVNPEK